MYHLAYEPSMYGHGYIGGGYVGGGKKRKTKKKRRASPAQLAWRRKFAQMRKGNHQSPAAFGRKLMGKTPLSSRRKKRPGRM